MENGNKDDNRVFMFRLADKMFDMYIYPHVSFRVIYAYTFYLDNSTMFLMNFYRPTVFFTSRMNSIRRPKTKSYR